MQVLEHLQRVAQSLDKNHIAKRLNLNKTQEWSWCKHMNFPQEYQQAKNSIRQLATYSKNQITSVQYTQVSIKQALLPLLHNSNSDIAQD